MEAKIEPIQEIGLSDAEVEIIKKVNELVEVFNTHFHYHTDSYNTSFNTGPPHVGEKIGDEVTS